MTFRPVPSGARVELRCTPPKGKRKGCPFKTKRVAVKRGQASAAGAHKNKRFAVGAKLEIRVTKAGSIGKVVRLTMRARKNPKNATLCLRPGTSAPRSRC